MERFKSVFTIEILKTFQTRDHPPFLKLEILKLQLPGSTNGYLAVTHGNHKDPIAFMLAF